MAQHAGAPRTRWPQARLREAAQDRRHRGVFREWMTSYFAVWRSGPMCRRAADPLAAGPLAGSGAGPPAPSGFPGMDDIVLRGMAKWPNVLAVARPPRPLAVERRTRRQPRHRGFFRPQLQP